MTKLIDILPKDIFDGGDIELSDILAFRYKKTSDALCAFQPGELTALYADMCLIRETELMLDGIKRHGEYCGIRHTHPGPAHLCIGQEAMYAGAAYLLRPEDVVLSSHRCHGDVIAKGASCIRALPDDALISIMQGYLDGDVYRAVRDDTRPVPLVARDFLLYGLICEMFAKSTGFNRGLGGPMHAFFAPFGIYPNNALVGGSADIAVGAALYKLINKAPGVAVCDIGDAALACGPVWEAMNLACMDQYRTLWGTGGPPLIFNISDNFYGMGGQTRGETMGYREAGRVAAGLRPDAMHAERINGLDVLAVIDAYRRAIPLAKSDGPVLLDFVNYRTCGHSASDHGGYRSEAEVEAWQELDPIAAFGAELKAGGVCTPEQLNALREDAHQAVLRCTRLAVDDRISPYDDPSGIERLTYSNVRTPVLGKNKPETLLDKASSPALTRLSGLSRFGLDAEGKPLPKERVYQFRHAIAEPIINKFYEDGTLIAFGEDVRDWGGAFDVYGGFTESLPYKRFFNTPIAEGAIVGAAVGYALSGGRAVAEIMYGDFLGRAGDELINQLPKWHAMSAGTLNVPVVIRTSIGHKYGAQHAQDLSAMLAHVPGLKVVYPATPYDAKGLMQSALNGADPVIFFESQRLYSVGERFHQGGVTEAEYEIEIGLPDVKREGTDVTILTIGATLYRALDAANMLAARGISCEIVDARSLVPFDYAPLITSAEKTGRVVVVGDAVTRGSFMQTLASGIAELCTSLKTAPIVLGARNWVTPVHEYGELFFPTAAGIAGAVECALEPNGEKALKRRAELLRRSREGV